MSKLQNFITNISRNFLGGKGYFSAPKGTIFGNSILGEGIRIAPDSLWAVYKTNADVFGCVREWSTTSFANGFKLQDSRDEEMAASKDKTDEINKFWKRSGGFRRVKNVAIRDLGVCGNAFFEIIQSAAGTPHSLKRLDPRTMSIVATKHGEIIKYIQRIAGQKTVEFEPNEIWHIKLTEDPDNDLVGMSPLETALWEARTDISAAQSNYYFFENDATPSTIYILDDGLSSEEQKTAFEDIKQAFSGARNRNKSAALGGVKDIKTISVSQKDMEFIQGRKFNTDKICSVYGVAKFILGYTETVNYSSGVRIMQKFYRGTIQPLEGDLAESINDQLFLKMGIEGVKFVSNPQTFGEEVETADLAIREFQAGLITMRQYKVITGKEITPEDEQEPFIDVHILANGGSATLLSDVGVSPVVDVTDPATAQNMIKTLKDHVEKYAQHNQ